ncbi:MAG: magnesium-protoporphyrin IX monomethyl ester (oxidative) cyclase [Pseudanabaenaceae cyanobacterium]
MVATPAASSAVGPKVANAEVQRKETILTPRFYTTDFDALANMDVSALEADFQAILREFQADYNRKHFVRDAEFEQSWAHLSDEIKAEFRNFLEGSCMSEFSGFLLYKEIAVRVKAKNPVMAEIFSLMSRDEARHAGFLNKAMQDFDMVLDLSGLSQTKKYTYFEPKFIFYATYLSEKIGYWRYIKIHQHLAAHPENRVYPIFKFFESWCQDESRHGDFCNLLLKTDRRNIEGWQAKFWSRFFLLSVFATMYLNDLVNRKAFYEALGMDTRQYVEAVLRDTNRDAAKAFPVILDLEHPEFWARLQDCEAPMAAIAQIQISERPQWQKVLAKLPHQLKLAGHFARLFFLKPIAIDRSTVR